MEHFKRIIPRLVLVIPVPWQHERQEAMKHHVQSLLNISVGKNRTQSSVPGLNHTNYARVNLSVHPQRLSHQHILQLSKSKHLWASSTFLPSFCASAGAWEWRRSGWWTILWQSQPSPESWHRWFQTRRNDRMCPAHLAHGMRVHLNATADSQPACTAASNLRESRDHHIPWIGNCHTHMQRTCKQLHGVHIRSIGQCCELGDEATEESENLR